MGSQRVGSQRVGIVILLAKERGRDIEIVGAHLRANISLAPCMAERIPDQL